MSSSSKSSSEIHIDRTKQRFVYTDFGDEFGAGAQVVLTQIGAVDFNRSSARPPLTARA